jgi:hypothetical protein
MQKMYYKNMSIMKTTYYLNKGRNKNLYCRINDGKERATFSLEYTVNEKDWDPRGESVKFKDEYYFILNDFKKYLNERYEKLKYEGKDHIIDRLKNEALSFMKDSGIEGVAKNLFNHYNKKDHIPEYDDFVKAFEKFSNLKKGEYKVEAIGSMIHFHTEDVVYEMDTYEGKTANLKFLIKNRLYDEIYTETDKSIWSHIYVDAGIDKIVFLPEMLLEWEKYWNQQYKEIQEKIGKTNHLDAHKEESWRSFQVFMNCYNDAGDIIDLAYNINDFILFPLSVITMLRIFDPDVCYQEYCECEFFQQITYEWESIELNEEDDNSPMFFIRECEI